MIDTVAALERAKYERVWADRNRAYAAQSDGEPLVDLAYEKMRCRPGESLVDWGCGCGRTTFKFQEKGLKVLGVDIAENCLDENLRGRFPFLQLCLWDGDLTDTFWDVTNFGGDYAFCADVLEHIPTGKVGLVMAMMAHRTNKAAFIQVCVLADTYGAEMQPPTKLHLTVREPEFWFGSLRNYWSSVTLLPLGGKARRAYVCFK